MAKTVLLRLVVSTTIGAIVSVYILAARIGIQRARRRWVFVLSDKEIVRKREGWPDDRIAFSEIDALYDGPGGLVVASADPLRRLSIPREVSGIETIRAELAKHHPFSAQTNPPRAKLSGTGLVAWLMTILSWAALIVIFCEVMRRR